MDECICGRPLGGDTHPHSCAHELKAQVERLREEGLSTFEALQEQGAQAERLRGERDEALRLLANATDPENAGDWDEARAEGWKFASERADDHA